MTSARPSSPPCANRCAPTGSRSPNWRATGSSSPSSTRPNRRHGRSCGAWSGAANGPTRPCARCPPSPPPCARAGPRSGPRGPTWNPPSPRSDPVASPSSRCPPPTGRVSGACLIGWDAPHVFGPDERALLTASAGLAGQALMRAHAFDAEHELVGMLQRQLLPRRLPKLPGAVAVARYLPTTAGLEVGGDWYDVIPLPDNHVALVIGDVQGHNAGAATLMGQMRTALRAYAVEGHPGRRRLARQPPAHRPGDRPLRHLLLRRRRSGGRFRLVRAGRSPSPPSCVTRTAAPRSPTRRADHRSAWSSRASSP